METIKYRVIFDKIEKRRIISETPYSVWWVISYGERHESRKISTSEAWFDSFDEAQKWLISSYQYLIEHNQKAIDSFSKIIQDAESLVDSDIEIK